MLCTVNTVLPQDGPARNRRCKCIDLGQWLRSIVSSTRRPVHVSQVLISYALPTAKSDPTTVHPHNDDCPTCRMGSMSPEDGLHWALAHGNLDELSAALGRNADPFNAYVQECFASLDPFTLDEKSRILTAQKIQLFRKYSDDYLLIKLIGNTKHTPTKAHAEILAYTPLPTVLADIITDYMDSFTYQLKASVMHYLSQKIMGMTKVNEKKLWPLFPRCTDEKGNTLLDYVNKYSAYWHYEYLDPFVARQAQQIVEQWHDCPIIFDMINVHIHNLTQDPVLFASPLDIKLFAKKLRECVNPRANWDFKKDDFETSNEYKIIQSYITAVPSLLSMHDDNQSIFDYVDAACNSDTIRAGKVNSLLRLFLEHKADPNMQDKKTGNTFLHRVASNQAHFNAYDCPDNAPFIQQCAPQLDLTIANNDRHTVFDILESRIKYCNEHKLINTRKYYQKFMQKLTAIKALATQQPGAKIVTLS